jgi:hypothetical protein
MTDLSDVERDLLGDILSRLAARYDNVFETSFPYSMGFTKGPQTEKCIPSGIFMPTITRRYCARQEIPLNEAELAALYDGLSALESLLSHLVDVPTPAGPTPLQLRATALVQIASSPSEDFTRATSNRTVPAAK